MSQILTVIGARPQFIKAAAQDDSIYIDRAVAASEKLTGYRNMALANYIKAFGVIENPVDHVLGVYFHHCSIAMSCRQLAAAGRFLAFEVQAKAQGGLNRSTRVGLTSAKPRRRQSTKLKPGGRLFLECNGATHFVDVTKGGFEWRGQSWRSLSVIAREITGAHWSGPRFFGLNR